MELVKGNFLRMRESGKGVHRWPLEAIASWLIECTVERCMTGINGLKWRDVSHMWHRIPKLLPQVRVKNMLGRKCG
jgi:hypothetical protein